jgi:hypothetical protein
MARLPPSFKSGIIFLQSFLYLRLAVTISLSILQDPSSILDIPQQFSIEIDRRLGLSTALFEKH